MIKCFTDIAWEEYLYWQINDKKTLEKINELIKEIERTPFKGTGKPEALKNELKGYWSRRINYEDRLVYKVEGKGVDQTLIIVKCKFHYK